MLIRLITAVVLVSEAVFGAAQGSLLPVVGPLNGSPPGLSQTVSPLHGKAFTLTVNGQNFAQGAHVVFGNISLTTSFVSAAQLTATVPESALVVAGRFPVKVTNPDGPQSNAIDFFVVARGDINGNGRVNVVDALVAARRAGGIQKPALANAVGDLNLDGSVNAGDALVLASHAGRRIGNLPTPSITSASANPVARGAQLTLTGTGFSPVASDQTVVFATANQGTFSVTPASATAATISVVVPGDAVSGAIQVVRLDSLTASGAFPLMIEGAVVPLLLTSISPFYFVEPGAIVTLHGMGFDPDPVKNTVTFRTLSGTVTRTAIGVTATTLVVDVPASATCGVVTVSTGNKTSNTRTLAVAGTTCPLQVVDFIGGGNPGDITVIEGSGFDVVTPSRNIVKFAAAGGGTLTAPVLQAGETQLHVRIPDGAVDGNMTLTVGDATSNTRTYRSSSGVMPAFVDVIVSSESPVGSYDVTIGYDRNVVQLSTDSVSGGAGTGFTVKPSKVVVDNANGAVIIGHSQQSQSPTGTFTVARLSFTGVSIGSSNLTVSVNELKDRAGNNLSRPPADVRLSSSSVRVHRLPDAPSSAPVLTSMLPNRAPVGSSLRYILAGSNFVVGGTTVSVAGTDVTVVSVNVMNSSSMSFGLSIGAAAALGPRDVRVQTSAGSATTSLTITAPPAISSVVPASAVAGATLNTVRINGSNLDVFAAPVVAFIPQGGTVPEIRFRVTGVSVESAAGITFSLQVGSAQALVTPGEYRVEVRDDFSAPQIRTQTVSISDVNVFSVISVPPVPTLSSIIPAAGLQGETIKLALSGTNFIAGATTLSISGTGVIAGTVVILSSTSGTVPLIIAGDAAPTGRLVTVMTPGGTTDTFTFTVIASETAPLGTYSAGTPLIRVFRSTIPPAENPYGVASEILRVNRPTGLADGSQSSASATVRMFFNGPLDASLGIASPLIALSACLPTVAIGVNLIVNPGAEFNAGAADDVAVVKPSCWTTTGNFGVVRYGVTGFPAAGAAGLNFFAGGPNSASSSASQTIDVSSLAASIDAGTLTANLSALLGGGVSQFDYMSVSVTFKSAAGGSLGSLGVALVMDADRGNTSTTLLAGSRAAPVPRQTRSIVVTMSATRATGTYNNAYADNLSLVLTSN